jgi:hypothetical protein
MRVFSISATSPEVLIRFEIRGNSVSEKRESSYGDGIETLSEIVNRDNEM